MALFFDQAWFNDKLASLGFDRAVIASALGMSPDQIDEVWKDQRELTAQHVATLAVLLQVNPAEVATRAGVSTPTPNKGVGDVEAENIRRELNDIQQRLGRLEKNVADVLTLLRAKRD